MSALGNLLFLLAIFGVFAAIPLAIFWLVRSATETSGGIPDNFNQVSVGNPQVISEVIQNHLQRDPGTPLTLDQIPSAQATEHQDNGPRDILRFLGYCLVFAIAAFISASAGVVCFGIGNSIIKLLPGTQEVFSGGPSGGSAQMLAVVLGAPVLMLMGFAFVVTLLISLLPIPLAIAFFIRRSTSTKAKRQPTDSQSAVTTTTPSRPA